MAKGQKTGGRVKGTRNRTTTVLMDAILMAGEITGDEISPEDQDGLVSYLWWLSKEQPASFATLLGKVLPMQVVGGGGGALRGAIEVQIVDSKRQPVSRHAS